MGIKLQFGESLSIVDRIVYPRLYCDVCNKEIDNPDFNVEIKDGDNEQFYYTHKECSYKLPGLIDTEDYFVNWQPGDNFFLALMGNLGIIDKKGCVTSSIERKDLVIP